MVSPPLTSIPDQVASVLASRDRYSFLSQLARELTLFNRYFYPPVGSAAYHDAFGLIGINELLHALTNELGSQTDESRSMDKYRSGIERLNRSAATWKCELAWKSSLHQAIATMAPTARDEDFGDSFDLFTSASNVIDPDDYIAFLAELLLLLSEQARALQLPTGSDAATFAAQVACGYAVQGWIAEQLRKGNPQDSEKRQDGLTILAWIDEADRNGCGEALRFAVDRTVAALRRFE